MRPPDSVFIVKDSGQRIDYPSGMRRDIQDGKTDYLLVRDGPMFRRWAEHLTKGAAKYGRRNWQLANSEEELERFRASAARHFEQWLAGERDEDHAAAVIFNINAAEDVAARLPAPVGLPPVHDEHDHAGEDRGGGESAEDVPDHFAHTANA